MEKYLFISLFLVCFTLTGCMKPAEHVHEWDNGTVTKEPNCTESGIKTFNCGGCEETKTENIPSLGHTLVKDDGYSATCTTTGLTDGEHCSVCEFVTKGQTTISKLTHDYDENDICKTCSLEKFTIGLQFELNGDVYYVVGYTGTDKNVIVPSKYEGKPVTVIANNAFKETSIETIKLPNSIIEIGANAFEDCEDLKSIEIPANVQVINEGTFRNCESLSTVTFAGNVTEISEEAFYACTNLYSITLPESLETIGGKAFYYCEYLSNISIPSNVSVIKAYAFAWTKIKSIEIPANVQVLEACTFSNCRELETVTLNEGLKEIQEYAFMTCKKLKSIHIPSTVTKIEPYLFAYTEVLTNITVAENNTVYDSRNNCKAIIETETNTLIAGCGRTFIPNTVTKIGEAAFFACKNLSSITIPTSVTELGESAFALCEDLSSIVIPESITYIPKALLSGCRTISTIIIKGEVQVIDEDAFNGTIYLRKLVLPATITRIGDGAFTNMSTHKDTKIYFRGTGTQWSQIINIDKAEFKNFTMNGHVIFNYDGEE